MTCSATAQPKANKPTHQHQAGDVLRGLAGEQVGRDGQDDGPRSRKAHYQHFRGCLTDHRRTPMQPRFMSNYSQQSVWSQAPLRANRQRPLCGCRCPSRVPYVDTIV